jgi:hypothetical protein
MTRKQQLLRQWFYRVPWRYQLYFLHCLLCRGAWRAGRVGWMWAHLRSEVLRLCEYKAYELKRIANPPYPTVIGAGQPDPRVQQFE